uniref:Uncharacterized protein n=1 Tax=uncultured marine virus TaxID=186617 RepID=A0A0F7L4U5_9VIRU|nr:hypothetical protein [uncultured marine virus]
MSFHPFYIFLFHIIYHLGNNPGYLIFNSCSASSSVSPSTISTSRSQGSLVILF